MTDSNLRNIYIFLYNQGNEVSPRGLLIKEIENFSFNIEPYVRFISFKSRNLKVDYIKKEFLWYLKGDRFDDSICNFAKLWKTVMNSDGSFNSNYGQYIFGDQNQYDNVFNILKKDKDSRRASIVILNKDHLKSNSNDIPCTYSISFRIRNNKLNMSVRMRSNDAIYGLGNDLPCFSIIHEMMYNSLKEVYPSLEYGIYNHNAESFHVYEKHFQLLEKIAIGNDEYISINCPKIKNSQEVKFLRQLDFSNIPEDYQFTRWLVS